MRRLILTVIGVLAVAAAATGASTPPSGATALCRDGTYSYSQTHSGTCSHHGGVAQWLSAISVSPSGPSQASAPNFKTTTVAWSAGDVDVGVTVLLAPRTKTSGCTLGPNPDRRCSPGAYYSKLTKAVICSSGFRTSTIRNVPEGVKHAVEAEYGLPPASYGSTLEIDHIVSLELGGSNDIANLFPEKANANPGYHVKDKLENKLHAVVCAGQIALRTAQKQIATNWQALYKKVYGTAPAG